MALKATGGKKGIYVNHEVGIVSFDQRRAGIAEGFDGNVTVLPTTNDPADARPRWCSSSRTGCVGGA